MSAPSSTAAPTRWLRWRWEADRLIALVAMVPATLLGSVLGLAIRATSPGGALVGLPRAGRHGRLFRMWKLRSMRPEEPAADTGPRITLAGNDRITPIGRQLRRFRVDELPQLWNIVRGEMAIIGPRPETPELVDPGNPAWAIPLEARPGIAGPSQVMVHDWEAGLSDAHTYEHVVLPVKLAIDRWYVTNASAAVDLAVVWATARAMLGLGGRSGLQRRILAEVPEAAGIPGAPDPAAGARTSA